MHVALMGASMTSWIAKLRMCEYVQFEIGRRWEQRAEGASRISFYSNCAGERIVVVVPEFTVRTWSRGPDLLLGMCDIRPAWDGTVEECHP